MKTMHLRNHKQLLFRRNELFQKPFYESENYRIKMFGMYVNF